MGTISAPEMVGCWPLGAIIDPDADNDEQTGKSFEEPEEND
jgi:hypothetical protein